MHGPAALADDTGALAASRRCGEPRGAPRDDEPYVERPIAATVSDAVEHAVAATVFDAFV